MADEAQTESEPDASGEPGTPGETSGCGYLSGAIVAAIVLAPIMIPAVRVPVLGLIAGSVPNAALLARLNGEGKRGQAALLQLYNRGDPKLCGAVVKALGSPIPVMFRPDREAVMAHLKGLGDPAELDAIHELFRRDMDLHSDDSASWTLLQRYATLRPASQVIPTLVKMRSHSGQAEFVRAAAELDLKALRGVVRGALDNSVGGVSQPMVIRPELGAALRELWDSGSTDRRALIAQELALKSRDAEALREPVREAFVCPPAKAGKAQLELIRALCIYVNRRPKANLALLDRFAALTHAKDRRLAGTARNCLVGLIQHEDADVRRRAILSAPLVADPKPPAEGAPPPKVAAKRSKDLRGVVLLELLKHTRLNRGKDSIRDDTVFLALPGFRDREAWLADWLEGWAPEALKREQYGLLEQALVMIGRLHPSSERFRTLVTALAKHLPPKPGESQDRWSLHAEHEALVKRLGSEQAARQFKRTPADANPLKTLDLVRLKLLGIKQSEDHRKTVAELRDLGWRRWHKALANDAMPELVKTLFEDPGHQTAQATELVQSLIQAHWQGFPRPAALEAELTRLRDWRDPPQTHGLSHKLRILRERGAVLWAPRGG